jgi:Amidohydrolase
MKTFSAFLLGCMFLQGCASTMNQAKTPSDFSTDYYADAHFHNLNYAYQGISLKTLLDQYMGSRVARSTVMPIPLQQKWEAYEHFAHDAIAPNYYLGPKAELYYYAFADAMVARAYLDLSPQDQARLDPMITGFNPMDHYAPDHIKRVLLTFPGVFSGIGEFTIHKEIVSKKIAGQAIKQISQEKLPPDIKPDETLTLHNPSLTRILNLVAETGLVATLHNDMYEADVQWDGKVKQMAANKPYVEDLIALCQSSPKAKVIWAHTGLGRFVKPTSDHLTRVTQVLDACPNWVTDISWDLVQQTIVNPEPNMPSLQSWATFITKYQDRVLWGSDTVAYSKNAMDEKGNIKKGAVISVKDYQAVLDITQPLWNQLGSITSQKVKHTNYERLFNQAKQDVRLWEKKHQHDNVWALPQN